MYVKIVYKSDLMKQRVASKGKCNQTLTYMSILKALDSERNLKMQRILVIGCSGAGKSTFAKELGQKLNIEVIHLDALFWNAGWVPTPKAQWREKVVNLCQNGQWIMDGNYGSTLSLRLQYADAVILFDTPRLQCLWRAIKRRLMYAGKTRPDMAAGCPEKIDGEFLKWIWNFKKNEKPQIMKLLDAFSGKLFIVKNKKDSLETMLSIINNQGLA